MRTRTLAILLLLCSPAVADVQSQLTAFHPSRLGVDRAGSLWAWNAENGAVLLLPSKGKQHNVTIDERAMTVDVDGRLGVAAVGPLGRDLVITTWQGKKSAQTSLPFAAGSVAWIDRDRVALAPLFGKHRLIIWRIATQRIDSILGEVPELDENTPGAKPARATLLAYDAARDEIVTVDAYYGEVVGYTSSGRVMRRASLPHPNQATTDEWLQGLDRQHRQDRTSFRPVVWSYPTVTLDADGTAWLGAASTDDAVGLVGVERSGAIAKKSLSSRCPGVRFVMWQKSVLFFRDPQSTRPYCIEQRRLQ